MLGANYYPDSTNESQFDQPRSSACGARPVLLQGVVWILTHDYGGWGDPARKGRELLGIPNIVKLLKVSVYYR